IDHRHVAAQHAVGGVDRQDRPAAVDQLAQGRSDPEKLSGNSSAIVHERTSPLWFTAVTRTAAGSFANSRSTCRQPPHGAAGGDAFVTTTTSSRSVAPCTTAFAIALRSAH